MECNRERNLEHCNCTYEPCSRKGICCECILQRQKTRQAARRPVAVNSKSQIKGTWSE